jgi:hypothetical protein
MRRRRTAVCTLATGAYEELVDVAAPTFTRFARLHDHDLVIVRHELSGGRPTAWGKLSLLRELLETYDAVAWLDADTVVVDPTDDLLGTLTRSQPMKLVFHRYGGLEIPNLGVIAVASTKWTKWFLERLWTYEAYVDHCWWENAAALDLLGYDVDEPRAATRRRTSSTDRVGELDVAWNSIRFDCSPTPRVVHFPGLPLAERLGEMRRAALGSVHRVGEPFDGERLAAHPGLGLWGLHRLVTSAGA